MTKINPAQIHNDAKGSGEKSERLHYLDWLRVLAILGVFLFHTLRPFDEIPWEINNSEKSVLAMLAFLLFLPWGMPLFFFLSGSGACILPPLAGNKGK